jgi:gluconolactonase
MNARPQRVTGVPPDPATGQNIEGPVWIGGSLYLSEITFGNGIDPARILKHTPGGSTTVFLANAGTNGLALSNDGRLLAARHSDGSIASIDLANPMSSTPLITQYMGARFNSPNDLAVHSNGSIYFTDPDYQGPSPAPQAEERAYWVASGGMPQPIAGAPTKPNGITLSRDEATLFILGNNGLFRYPVAANGSVGARTNMTNQGGDGMGKDCAGNLYVTQGNQVRVFDRSFREVTPAIAVPITGGSVTNVAFGGANRQTLYITSLNPPSLFSVELNVPGYPY